MLFLALQMHNQLGAGQLSGPARPQTSNQCRDFFVWLSQKSYGHAYMAAVPEDFSGSCSDFFNIFQNIGMLKTYITNKWKYVQYSST